MELCLTSDGLCGKGCGVDGEDLHRVPIIVAGRTDAGVHARAQCFHVDLPLPLNEGMVRGVLQSGGRNKKQPGYQLSLLDTYQDP